MYEINGKAFIALNLINIFFVYSNNPPTRKNLERRHVFVSKNIILLF